MKQNFDQKINEMLVVLNAVKKKSPKDEKCDGCQCEDPVTCAMNDALKSLGFNVVDKEDINQSAPEDGLDGIEGRIEDLDLPRPADDGENAQGDEEGDDDGGEDDSEDGNPFDPLGDGVEDLNDGETNGDDGVSDNGGVEDENDSDELKIKRIDGGDVVFSFGGKSVTVTKDNLGQIVDFLSEGDSDDDGSPDDESDDDDSDDDSTEDDFGDEDD